eukprot:gene7431-11754_t
MEILTKNNYSIPNIQVLTIEKLQEKVVKIVKKDLSTVYFKFKDPVVEFSEWLSNIFLEKIEDVFAFKFSSHFLKENNLTQEYLTNEWIKNNNLLQNDLNRFTNSSKYWKIFNQFTQDQKYFICPTYPYNFIIPIAFDEEKLKKASLFRSKQRLPVICWKSNDDVLLLRSSQPNSGFTQSSKLDVELISKYCERDETKTKIQFIDCRPLINATANIIKGYGFENVSKYKHSNISFENIDNIHSVTKCFKHLSEMDFKYWVSSLSSIIQASIRVVSHIKNNVSVLIHCSDGWDRTPQVVGLSQILLDPYYRTLEGFQVLIEREWISFGHMFLSRNNLIVSKDNESERSPIFRQFLDCVLLIMTQFPNEFEFNYGFILVLLEQSSSGLFGNFLFDSEFEGMVKKKYSTCSFWTLVNQKKEFFINFDFNPKEKIINSFVEDQIFHDFWKICNLHTEKFENQNSTDISSYKVLVDELEKMIKEKNIDVSNLKKQIRRIKKGNTAENIHTDLFSLSKSFHFSFDQLLRIGSCDIVHDDTTGSDDVYFSKNGSLFHAFKKPQIDDWNINRIASSSGDISAIFEVSNNHSAVYFVNEEGYLSYCYFDSKWNFERFKSIGKVRSRISGVYESNRSHSAVFCLVENSIFYIFNENGSWRTDSSIFKKYPCNGDLSAVFHQKYSKSALLYEGKDGYIHYWIMNNSNPIHKILSNSKPNGGIMKSVYDSSISQLVLVYSDGKTGDLFYSDIKAENEVKPIQKKSTGDIQLFCNLETKTIELVYPSGSEMLFFSLNQEGIKEIAQIKSYCISPIAMCCLKKKDGKIERKLVYYSTEGNGVVECLNFDNSLKTDLTIQKSLFEQEDFIYFAGERKSFEFNEKEK